MTVRAPLLVALFDRCETARPDVAWIPGYVGGDEAPLDRVYVWELEGSITEEAGPGSWYDPFTLTVHFESEAPGQSRAEAMTKVESWVTTVVDIVRIDPRMGGEIDPALATYVRMYHGPYSMPNPHGAGFAGAAALDVEFQSYLAEPATYPTP